MENGKSHIPLSLKTRKQDAGSSSSEHRTCQVSDFLKLCTIIQTSFTSPTRSPMDKGNSHIPLSLKTRNQDAVSSNLELQTC
ncbi:hypothetical protein P8452_42794 [Trifolium repens]|nr:hypothetical protein P8452_42794 [Trifolium repens]